MDLTWKCAAKRRTKADAVLQQKATSNLMSDFMVNLHDLWFKDSLKSKVSTICHFKLESLPGLGMKH